MCAMLICHLHLSVSNSLTPNFTSMPLIHSINMRILAAMHLHAVVHVSFSPHVLRIYSLSLFRTSYFVYSRATLSGELCCGQRGCRHHDGIAIDSDSHNNRFHLSNGKSELGVPHAEPHNVAYATANIASKRATDARADASPVDVANGVTD
jgi:hypothetical protein